MESSEEAIQEDKTYFWITETETSAAAEGYLWSHEKSVMNSIMQVSCCLKLINRVDDRETNKTAESAWKMGGRPKEKKGSSRTQVLRWVYS